MAELPRIRFISARALARLGVLVAVGAGALSWSYVAMIRMPGRSFRGPLPPLSEAQSALADGLRGDVRRLAGDLGERNLDRYDALVAAAGFIETSLAQAGYEVTTQDFQAGGHTCRNLAVEIPGATRPGEIVVVGGHYDTVPGCPGANDNATGVAATLALARAMRDARPDRTLRFAFFANEEPPYFQTRWMGSRVYAHRCRKHGDDVVAMLSLETIGYYSDADGSQKYPPPFGLLYPSTGDFIAFVGNFSSRALVREVVGSFRRHARFPSEGGALPSVVPGVGWSDHWAFWQEGYPALMVTDTAPFRYPDYHLPTDTPEKIDYGRMARVVEGLQAVLRELAAGP